MAGVFATGRLKLVSAIRPWPGADWRRKLRLGISFFLASIAVALAQSEPPSLLKASDLQADAALLRRVYETLHPGLYRYNSPRQMNLEFAELNRRLNHDQTLQEAFLAFSEFAAKLRCGHTQANPFNQSKAVAQALLESSSRVPFYFQWLDRRMIVTRDFTPDHSLAVGTEVVALNGVPAAHILDKLMTVTRADGANDSKRVAQLSVTGASEYETFDIYFPMFFPQSKPEIDLLIQRPGASKQELFHARLLTFEQRISPIKEREELAKGRNETLFEWKYFPQGAAYLRMPIWALYNGKWDWKRWLHERIDEAVEHEAQALILDLRGNEGGDDVGREILSRLIDAPITSSPMQRLVRYRQVPNELLPYLHTWDKSFADWGTAALELSAPWPTAPEGVPYFKLKRGEDSAEDVVQPAGRRFRGKVIVLIDATNSSATFQFAQNLQRHHLGILIGQPTGGSQRGINGGAFFFLQLPHSGIEMDVPLIGTFPPSPSPDTGVIPDVLVSRTRFDIAAGKDVELEAALATVTSK